MEKIAIIIFLFFPMLALAQVKDLPITEKSLLLKSSPIDIVSDKQVSPSVVEYAYKTQSVSVKRYNLIEENIYLRSPYSETYELDKNRYLTKYYTRNQYFKKDNVWYQLNYATTTVDAYIKQINSGASISFWSKVLPVAFASCGDSGGQCYDTSNDALINSGYVSGLIINAIDATTGYADSTDPPGALVSWYTDNTWNIRRGYMPFDTSALPDDVNISSSSIHLKLQSKQDYYNDTHDYVNIVSAFPAVAGQVSGSDYDMFGTQKISTDYDITNLNVDQWYNFELTASGTALISKTGYSQFGMKEGHDLDRYEGAHSYGFNYALFYQAETDGTASDPYLLIDYATSPPVSTSTQASVQIPVSAVPSNVGIFSIISTVFAVVALAPFALIVFI